MAESINKILLKLWESRGIIETPIKIIFILVVGAVACSEVYLSDNSSKYLWFMPMGLTLAALESLWNPFRVVAISSVWLGAYAISSSNAAIGVVAAILFISSLLCWHLYIQRPADLSMKQKVK